MTALLAVPLAPNSQGVPTPVGGGPRPLPWGDVAAWAKVRFYGDARPALAAVTAVGAFHLVTPGHYCDCRGVGREPACRVARCIERLRALVPDVGRPSAAEGFRVARVPVPAPAGPGGVTVPEVGLAVRLSRDGQTLTVAEAGGRGAFNRVFYRDAARGVWSPARVGAEPLPLAVGDAARAALESAELRAAHDALGDALAAGSRR